jgi:hypothetical protein
MSKLIGLAFAVTLLLSIASTVRESFSKYKAIGAYEIRPGILMMPRYSPEGQVCEVGLEELHYSPEIIRLEPSLSRKEIDDIFEELAPTNERGPRSNDFRGNLITQSGRNIITSTEYAEASIQIYSDVSPASGPGGTVVDDVVATLKWKNRNCQ